MMFREFSNSSVTPSSESRDGCARQIATVVLGGILLTIAGGIGLETAMRNGAELGAQLGDHLINNGYPILAPLVSDLGETGQKLVEALPKGVCAIMPVSTGMGLLLYSLYHKTVGTWFTPPQN